MADFFKNDIAFPKVLTDKLNKLKSLLSNREIKVNDSTTVLASGTTDPINFKQASGITVAGNTSNHSITIGHSNSQITSGTASGSTGSVSFGGSITLPSVTYDNYGHITGTGTTNVTLPNAPSSLDIPTVKNELIYSDDGENLNTHELMFTGGLVVDTPEDLNLCKNGADFSMSDVLSNWNSYAGGTESTDDKRRWGYCDSTADGNTQEIYLKGAIETGNPENWKQSVPVFKYNGAPQDYIFNTKNTEGNTGYYTSEKYSDYDSTITCGVLPNLQWGEYQDYMAIIPAIVLSGSGFNYNYGISIHVENESSTVTGRTLDYYAGGNTSGTTIQIIAWKQRNLNDTHSYDKDMYDPQTANTVNIGILSANDGASIIPFVPELDNASYRMADIHTLYGNYIKTSCIQTRTIRKGNIITFYSSDPYPVYKSHYAGFLNWVIEGEYTGNDLYPGGEFTRWDPYNPYETTATFEPSEIGGEIYNDDYNFKDTIHYERPIIINLDNYTVRYVTADGIVRTNDFSTGNGTNAIVREIFEALRGSAHRGFECESNPGTFFRNSSSHERIIDVTPGEYKVYDYDGNRWNWSFNTSNTMPTITISGGTVYTLTNETVFGDAKYKWVNDNVGVTPNVYYTKHPVPNLSTDLNPDYAYPTASATTGTEVNIVSVNGVKLLPQVVFENGSRTTWNRITDKLFYNNGATIYRISTTGKKHIAGSGIEVFEDNTNDTVTISQERLTCILDDKSDIINGYKDISNNEYVNTSSTQRTYTTTSYNPFTGQYNYPVSLPGSQYGTHVYKWTAHIDGFQNSKFTLVDLSTFYDNNISYLITNPNTITWTKTSGEAGKYINLLSIYATDGVILFQIDINNTQYNIQKTYKIGVAFDTEPDSTFCVVSDLNWGIECKEDSSNNMYCYLEIPDDFVGTINVKPLGAHARQGATVYSKIRKSWNNNWVTKSYISGNDGNIYTGELISSSDFEGSQKSTDIRIPYGKYYADLFYDLPANAASGHTIYLDANKVMIQILASHSEAINDILQGNNS